MPCENLRQVALEFGIEGGLKNFELPVKNAAKPLILGMVSASERNTAHEPQADAPEHVQGAAACISNVAASHSLQPKLLSSVSELREEIIANWRQINVFVFDTTATDFDCWEAINLVTNHRREHVRSRPALVILASEDSLSERERSALRRACGACAHVPFCLQQEIRGS